MIDKALIERKLKRIETFLREIEAQEGPSDFLGFSENLVFKRFVERNMELAVEQMIDVCKHLISGLDLEEPESYADCFIVIGRAGVLSASAVEIFKSMARFRNFLIHGYDGVDDTITYGIYKNRLGDFRLFIDEVRKFILPNDSPSIER